MACIQDSSYSLVFPVADINPAFRPASQKNTGTLSYRTSTRALDGMQKEAVVCCPEGTAWRMVCDEGPYLNGTDLAPFPLAFFCTGMVSSFMSEMLHLLKDRGIPFSKLRLLQDNRYSMEGSAVAGTMTGSALPVELQLEISSPAEPAELQQLLLEAIAASPAGALLKTVSTSEFSITHNHKSLEPDRVMQHQHKGLGLPTGFDEFSPDSNHSYPADIITKQKSASIQTGVTGGAGSSLAENQKRILHMRGICSLREDGLKQIEVELFQPLGSRFHFLSDDSSEFAGSARAPSGLAYLSAGIAFCYMTQIGRYANIVRKPFDSYHIVQDTAFSLPGATGNTGIAATIEPVITHVYLNSAHDSDYARRVVDMSEQTCFLHAACRQQVRVKLKEPLTPDA